jgi:hypothetical protein
LVEVLKGAFDTRFDQLDISTITKFEGDIACHVDASRSQGERDGCRARFKSQAVGAQLWRIADKFNDLLTNPGSTIVQAYAKRLLGTRRFYTVGDQKKVDDLLLYLDDLQVSATMASVEAENLDAVGKDPAAVAQAEATAGAESRTLEGRRDKQLNLNPTFPNPGVLDTRRKLWLSTSWQGQTTHPFEKVGGTWHLPTVDEVLNMVQDRGNKTVKTYLVEDAGMGNALARADEFGPQGELWTSTSASSCGFVILACWKAVSTNNAYVRTYNTSIKAGGGPKLFSFLVSGIDAQERTRYQFLWR